MGTLVVALIAGPMMFIFGAGMAYKGGPAAGFAQVIGCALLWGLADLVYQRGSALGPSWAEVGLIVLFGTLTGTLGVPFGVWARRRDKEGQLR